VGEDSRAIGEGTCTIVMYHYVRDPERSRYPGINALRRSEFEFQLEYLRREYSLVSMADLRRALHEGESLPPDAAHLTFDDGLLDHYTTVFPMLSERGIPASFFPPADPVLDDIVLNVHKIHFVLACVPDVETLLESAFARLDAYRERYDLQSNEAYYRELAEPGRWDPEEVVFVKRLLQRDLGFEVRSAIVDDLFEEHVDVTEEVLSGELYVDPDQLGVMIDAGMYVGGHGATHRWLGTLPPSEQRAEIGATVEFLATLGAPTDGWTMCYPYGSYDRTTLEILETAGCAAGLTTEFDEAVVSPDNALTLQRLDTTDLPRSPADRDGG